MPMLKVENVTAEAGITCWRLECRNTILCSHSPALYPGLSKHSLYQDGVTLVVGFGVRRRFRYVQGLSEQPQKAIKNPRYSLLLSWPGSLAWDAEEWMGSAAGHVFIPRQPAWSARRQSTVTGLGSYNALHCSSYPSWTACPVSYQIQASILWELEVILAHHVPISLPLSSFLSGKTPHNTEQPVSHSSWQGFLTTPVKLLRCLLAEQFPLSSPAVQLRTGFSENLHTTLPFHCHYSWISDFP